MKARVYNTSYAHTHVAEWYRNSASSITIVSGQPQDGQHSFGVSGCHAGLMWVHCRHPLSLDAEPPHKCSNAIFSTVINSEIGSHRASRPRTLTLHHSKDSSTYRVHFSPARAVALRRARGSNFAGETHERWGIHSSIGIQIRSHFSTSSSLNSPLTLPACAAAQVGVDFLTARSGHCRLRSQL